jgi:hypothetical protein
MGASIPALIDPRLGRATLAEWYDRRWPTVNNLRPSTRARDDQYFRSHVLPYFGSTLVMLDRTSLRSWTQTLSAKEGANLAPATVQKVVQTLNKCVAAAVDDRLIQHNPVAALPVPKTCARKCDSSRTTTSGLLLRRSTLATARSFCSGATAGFGSARCSRCDGVESISIGNESMSRKRSSTSTVTRPSVHPVWIAEGTHPKQVAVVAGHTSVSVVLDRYGHLYPHQDSLVEALERRLTQARDLRIAG